MNGRISNINQIAKCRRVVCADGRERGVRLIEIDNGLIRAELIESNALDIGCLSFMGKNVSFISANGYDAASDGFERTFPGGMLYTCGLESLGNRNGFPTHGSLHNIPCRTAYADVDNDGNIKVTGKMYFTALFGAKMLLTRTVELKSNSGELRIFDELENTGFKDEEYCMLYHLNFGYPFLTENAFLRFDALSTCPRTPFAAAGLDKIKTVQPPEDNEERVYFHKLYKPCVLIVSPDSGIQAQIEYSGDTLPCLVQWKSMISGDYALGIEPATSFLDDKFEFMRICAGQKITNTVVLKFDKISKEK